MPKVAYSDIEREQVRLSLITTGLDLMIKQGVQHTTVEQIYKKVGISRTFFYSFFPSKEDLIVEALYLQQPQIIAYAEKLMNDAALSWEEGAERFLHSCCYGEKYGIAVLTIEEQQLLFKRLSEESRQAFREKQRGLFRAILIRFGIDADAEQINLIINLFLMLLVTCRALPDTLPMLIPEAAGRTVEFQMNALLNYLAKLKKGS